MYQWKHEIQMTTGIESIIYHGKKIANISNQDLQTAPFVITTYYTISRTKEQFLMGQTKPIHDIMWNRIIFDEAHHLRNLNTRHYGARLLQSRIKWLVTGTPIQNRFKDISNLSAIYGIDDINLDNFAGRIPVLRRTKQQVSMNIPSKTVTNVVIDWNNDEEKRCAENITNRLNNLYHQQNWVHWMALYQYARMCCILPRMLRKHTTNLNLEIQDTENPLSHSSKLTAVCNNIISMKGNGNRKLVFCNYKAEMKLVKETLTNAGLRCNIVDGSLTPEQRNQVLQRRDGLGYRHTFANLPVELTRYIMDFIDIDVTILQIQTCCEGINLQYDYSEMHFVSPSWNPSVDSQAIARCHRMGQTKPVHVFKYRMADLEQGNQCMDSIVYSKQETKLDISRHFFENI